MAQEVMPELAGTDVRREAVTMVPQTYGENPRKLIFVRRVEFLSIDFGCLLFIIRVRASDAVSGQRRAVFLQTNRTLHHGTSPLGDTPRDDRPAQVSDLCRPEGGRLVARLSAGGPRRFRVDSP